VLREDHQTLGRLNRGYTRLLAVFLRRRLELVMALAVVFAVAALVAMKGVKVVEVQEEALGLQVDVRLPETTTFEEAEAFFLECEKVVEGSQEELGLSGWFIFHRPTFGEVRRGTRSKALRPVSSAGPGVRTGYGPAAPKRSIARWARSSR
jgi:hypothetical protein